MKVIFGPLKGVQLQFAVQEKASKKLFKLHQKCWKTVFDPLFSAIKKRSWISLEWNFSKISLKVIFGPPKGFVAISTRHYAKIGLHNLSAIMRNSTITRGDCTKKTHCLVWFCGPWILRSSDGIYPLAQGGLNPLLPDSWSSRLPGIREGYF